MNEETLAVYMKQIDADIVEECAEFATVETNQLAPSAARLFCLSPIAPVTTGASEAEIHCALSQA